MVLVSAWFFTCRFFNEFLRIFIIASHSRTRFLQFILIKSMLWFFSICPFSVPALAFPKRWTFRILSLFALLFLNFLFFANSPLSITLVSFTYFDFCRASMLGNRLSETVYSLEHPSSCSSITSCTLSLSNFPYPSSLFNSFHTPYSKINYSPKLKKSLIIKTEQL